MQPSPDLEPVYSPRALRIPGFGGAAVVLRPVVLPLRNGTAPAPGGAHQVEWGVDIDLVEPTTIKRHLGRRIDTDLASRLEAFLLSAAADWHPEESARGISEPITGLEMSVEGSTDGVVELLVRVVDDLSADEPDYAGLNFETSRAVLAQAARDAREVLGRHADAGPSAEPPREWSTL